MKQFYFICLFGVLTAFCPVPEKTTIFLCGDSTMADKLPSDAPETGWGTIFSTYFDEHKVLVQNHAINGRSTKSFIKEGRWEKVISQVKKGDWVFIQFGHNDAKISDSTRYAAPQTTFRNNLIRFVNETRAKGGNPVLIPPVMRRKFDKEGNFEDTHGEYPSVVRSIAQELSVPMIDLHAKSKAIIIKQGLEGSKNMFMYFTGGFYPKYPDGKTDDTHFSPYGASIMASLVADGIKELSLDLGQSLKKFGSTDKYLYQLPKILAPVFKKDTISIVQFGAINDGQTLNTQAIKQAIETCSNSGGGTVIIPKGLWLTASIELKNKVNLHLEKGALVQFSRNFNDYPLIKTNWEGVPAVRCTPPIYGIDLTNIAITGEGIFDGGGDAWRPIKKSKITASAWEKIVASGGALSEDKNNWFPSEKALRGSVTKNSGRIEAGKEIKDYEEIKDFLRPNMLSLTNCKQVLLEDFTIQNSPAWTLHPLLCQDIILRNLTVRNPEYAQNSDGVDLESCHNGLLENCTFDVGDDGICIKSGKDEEGRKKGIPTDNIIIQNNTVYHAHGGFVIGSEMSGGVNNLFVSNCNFIGTDVGLRFKTTRGRGGMVEKIYISDIAMTNIAGEAILFDMYYMAKDPVPQFREKNELPLIVAQALNEGTPQFRDFYVRNVVCRGAETGILIRGLPEMPIKNIFIENAILQSKKGLVCIESEAIHLKNVSLFTEESPVMQLQNSRNITLDGINYRENTPLLLKISGKGSTNIQCLHTDTAKAKKELELGNEVSEKVFFIK